MEIISKFEISLIFQLFQEGRLQEIFPYKITGRKSKAKYRKNKRIKVFLEKGIVCKKCGIKGEFFAFHEVKKSKNSQETKLFFDLFAKNKNGQLIRMTIDHIVPLAKGGVNTMENEQPLCYNCNNKKADHMD